MFLGLRGVSQIYSKAQLHGTRAFVHNFSGIGDHFLSLFLNRNISYFVCQIMKDLHTCNNN